jgi:hypothetical protein
MPPLPRRRRVSLAEKALIWIIAGAFIAIAVYGAVEALRSYDEDAFYE